MVTDKKKITATKILITTDNLGASNEGQFFHGYYFRNNYRKLVKINLALSLIAFLLLFGAIVQKITRSFPEYYTSSTDGSLQKITPLNPPNSYLDNILG